MFKSSKNTHTLPDIENIIFGFQNNDPDKAPDKIKGAQAGSLLSLLGQFMYSDTETRIFWKDKHLIYLGCNRAFASDAGFKDPAHLTGKSDTDLIWKESNAILSEKEFRIIQIQQAILNDDEPYYCSGTMRWRRISRIPLVNNNKVYGILGLYTDITKEHRLEDQLKILNAKLSVKEKKLKIQESLIKDKTEKYQKYLQEIRKSNRKLLLVKEALKKRQQKAQNFEPALINENSQKSFNRYFNTDDLQNLQNRIARLHNLSSVILDNNGNAVTKPSNLRELCHPANTSCSPDSSVQWTDTLGNNIKTGTCNRCGLHYAAIPILFSGHPIGNWVIGQVAFQGETLSKNKQVINENRVASQALFYELANFVSDIAVQQSNQALSRLMAEEQEYNSFTIETQADEQEGKIANILNTSPDLIMILDIEGYIQDVYTSHNEVFELRKATVKNELIDKILPAESAQKFHTAIAHTIETSEPDSFEYHAIQQGQQQWYQASTSRIEYNNQFCVITISKNVSEFVNTREQLLKNETEKRALLNNLPHLAWLKDTEGRFLLVNKTYAKTCGYPANRVKGLSDKDIWPAKQAERHSLCDKQILESGRSKSYEEQMVINNELRWFETFKSPIYSKQHKIIGITGISRDITEKKNALQALQESEEMYRQLISASPDCIIMANLSGHITYASPPAKDLFALSCTSEIIDTQLFDWLDNEFTSDLEHDLHNLTENDIAINNEYKFIRPDNSMFYGELHAALVRDFNKHPKAVIAIIRNTTERKLAEQKIIRAKEKAEENDKLKTSFLSNMSHEIRTPMNGILGFVNLLADPDLSTSERKEYIRIIHQNSSSLLRVIDDILDISRIEAGELEVSMAPCLINDILTDVYKCKLKTLNDYNKNIELRLQLPNNVSDVCVNTDKNRLNQILQNLLSNAIKFTYKGNITFGYTINETTLEFFVNDTGIGIKPEHQQVIFDRFRQVDNTQTREHGGTGLGLAITYHLVQLLGGNISVESAPGRGSNFRFTLPKKLSNVNNLDSLKQFTNKVKRNH